MKKVWEYIEKFHMIEKGDRIVVGVSGGADSVCLLWLLWEYRKKRYPDLEFELRVVHIEHGIRGEDSLADAAYVERLCGKLELEYMCFHFDIPAVAEKEKLTMEEAGRTKRYEVFERVAREWGRGKGKIAVAHNRNDQAETMLWNMIRGSGLRGAGGIKPVRDHIIRPLLCVERGEIEAYLIQKGIVWCDDATNQEEDYTRNILRRKVLPLMQERLNEQVTEHLAMLGEEIQDTEAFLQAETRRRYEACIKTGGTQTCPQIYVERLKREGLFMQERVIRLWLEEMGCGLKDITREHIRRIVNLADRQSGKQIVLPRGWRARREFEMLCVEQQVQMNEITSAEMEEATLVIGGETRFGNGRFYTRILENENQQIVQKTYTKWMNYDKINVALTIRTRQEGDYLVINRQGGKKKLKSYLTEGKIPVTQRNRIPLICMGQEVLWVVGHRIGEDVKIAPQTKKILEIVYEEDD